MKYKPGVHRRKSIRLKGFDYSQPGAYFVTIGTHHRECSFGEIVDSKMILNDFGKMILAEWIRTGDIRANIRLDEFVVMPNHIHGIICITNTVGADKNVRAHDNVGAHANVGAHCNVPLRPQTERFGQSTKNSIPTVVKLFKSTTTKQINQIRKMPGEPVWQRNYHEHVIRDENDLMRIRKYIQNNPAQWEQDQDFIPSFGSGS